MNIPNQKVHIEHRQVENRFGAVRFPKALLHSEVSRSAWAFVVAKQMYLAFLVVKYGGGGVDALSCHENFKASHMQPVHCLLTC